jgi:hypothetical protein
MGMFQPDNGPFLIERRKARRSRATCGASLRTLSGEVFGQLWDLSETGARISVPTPPERGESALLKWGTEQVMCRIVWADGDMCGLSFENPIAPAVVSATARLLGIVEHPTAAISNIPVGRRRSAAGEGPGRAEADPRPNLLASHATTEAPLPLPDRPQPLTAEEEMFLYNSPLAHVLAFEAHLETHDDF